MLFAAVLITDSKSAFRGNEIAAINVEGEINRSLAIVSWRSAFFTAS